MNVCSVGGDGVEGVGKGKRDMHIHGEEGTLGVFI